MDSDSPLAKESPRSIAPSWSRHRFRYGTELPGSLGLPVSVDSDSSLICSGNPITFRLKDVTGALSNWSIDNLALTGVFKPGGCGAVMTDPPSDLIPILDQLEHRLPGEFFVNGPGKLAEVRIVNAPGGMGPDPTRSIGIRDDGTDPTTTIGIRDDGTNPPASELVPIVVRTDLYRVSHAADRRPLVNQHSMAVP